MVNISNIVQDIKGVCKQYNFHRDLEGGNWPKNPLEGGYFGWRFGALKESIDGVIYDKRKKFLAKRDEERVRKEGLITRIKEGIDQLEYGGCESCREYFPKFKKAVTSAVSTVLPEKYLAAVLAGIQKANEVMKKEASLFEIGSEPYFCVQSRMEDIVYDLEKKEERLDR